jgi:hypothetical protein
MHPEAENWFSLLWMLLGDWQVGRIRGQGLVLVLVLVQVQVLVEAKWKYGLPRRLLLRLHAHPAETMCEELKGQSNL